MASIYNDEPLPSDYSKLIANLQGAEKELGVLKRKTKFKKKGGGRKKMKKQIKKQKKVIKRLERALQHEHRKSRPSGLLEMILPNLIDATPKIIDIIFKSKH